MFKRCFCGAVSMGNPHCVVQVDNIETANVAELGPLLENHERFQKGKRWIYASRQP